MRALALRSLEQRVDRRQREAAERSHRRRLGWRGEPNTIDPSTARIITASGKNDDSNILKISQAREGEDRVEPDQARGTDRRARSRTPSAPETRCHRRRRRSGLRRQAAQPGRWCGGPRAAAGFGAARGGRAFLRLLRRRLRKAGGSLSPLSAGGSPAPVPAAPLAAACVLGSRCPSAAAPSVVDDVGLGQRVPGEAHQHREDDRRHQRRSPDRARSPAS